MVEWVCVCVYARLSLNSLTQSSWLFGDLISCLFFWLCVSECLLFFFYLCTLVSVRLFDRTFVSLFSHFSKHTHIAYTHLPKHTQYTLQMYEYNSMKEKYWSRTWILNSPFASLLVKAYYMCLNCVCGAHPYTHSWPSTHSTASSDEWISPSRFLCHFFAFFVSVVVRCFLHSKLCYLTGI